MGIANSPEPLGRSIGRVAREVRVGFGWSQRDLAARIGHSQSKVARLEAGAVAHLDLNLADAVLRELGILPSFDTRVPGLSDRRRQRDRVHARCCGSSDGTFSTWDGRSAMRSSRERSSAGMDRPAGVPRRRRRDLLARGEDGASRRRRGTADAGVVRARGVDCGAIVRLATAARDGGAVAAVQRGERPARRG
jgi:transcriptional regulator with XRE-family HTH domain